MVKFERQTKYIATMSPQTLDIAFVWLCQELKQSAEQTDILDLVDVWDSYCKISDDAQAQFPTN